MTATTPTSEPHPAGPNGANLQARTADSRPHEAARKANDRHIGRAWAGHTRDDDCPCPQEPCGLVALSRVAPDCPEHRTELARTMRQIHKADRCPGTSSNPARVPLRPRREQAAPQNTKSTAAASTNTELSVAFVGGLRGMADLVAARHRAERDQALALVDGLLAELSRRAVEDPDWLHPYRARADRLRATAGR